MEVGGSKRGSSSLAIVFLIMLLDGPSQITHGKYFLHSFISSSLSICDCLSVFHLVILRMPFYKVLY